jgi:hypothetical protein
MSQCRRGKLLVKSRGGVEIHLGVGEFSKHQLIFLPPLMRCYDRLDRREE